MPGLDAWAYKIINQLTCILEETANSTATALWYINDKLSQIQEVVLQKCAAIDYLLLKNQIRCSNYRNVLFQFN